MLVACSFQSDKSINIIPEVIKTSSIPDFIVNNKYDSDDKQMCSVISQKTLWRSNDTANKLGDQIANSSVINLDDNEVRKSVKTYNEIYPVGNNGQILGTYGGNIELCFDVEDVPKGIHKVTIDFVITSGEKFIYSWSFRK